MDDAYRCPRCRRLRDHPDAACDTCDYDPDPDHDTDPEIPMTEPTPETPAPVSDDFALTHLPVGLPRQIARAVVEAVWSVVGRQPTGGGCRAFCTTAEWIKRGEEHGHESLLILVHDGGDLARCCNHAYGDAAAIDALRAAIEKLGLVIENCTSWYSAVYPIDNEAPRWAAPVPELSLTLGDSDRAIDLVGRLLGLVVWIDGDVVTLDRVHRDTRGAVLTVRPYDIVGDKHGDPREILLTTVHTLHVY